LVQGGLIHRLTRRAGLRPVFAVATVGLALGFVTVGFAPGEATFFAGCAVIGVCYGLASPTLNALISRNTPGARQGATFGVAQSAAGLGRAVGHLGAGALFHLRPALPFAAAGAALLLVVALFQGFKERYPRDLVDESEPPAPAG